MNTTTAEAVRAHAALSDAKLRILRDKTRSESAPSEATFAEYLAHYDELVADGYLDRAVPARLTAKGWAVVTEGG